MTRASDNDRRTELAEAVAGYFIASGNVRQSLRDLAPEVGSSARMLVHYFETREALVAAALENARQRQLAAAERTLSPSTDVRDGLDNVWKWYKRDDTRQYFKLFNDVVALEQLSPVEQRQFGPCFGTEWRPMFEALFKTEAAFAKDAKVLAHLLIATIRGFALELNNGSDTRSQRATYVALSKMIMAR